jgi:hypothetical protein
MRAKQIPLTGGLTASEIVTSTIMPGQDGIMTAKIDSITANDIPNTGSHGSNIVIKLKVIPTSSFRI